MSGGEGRVARAFREACLAELAAIKPGNVFAGAEGRGMTVSDFMRSAEAAAPAIGQAGISVGERILRAIAATRQVVSHNTNLGIVLLAAPIASAALNSSSKPSSSSFPGSTRASTATERRPGKTVDGRVKPGHDEVDSDAQSLRARLSDVLSSLTRADAVAAYRAIRLAGPGGMGEVGAESVEREPSVTLLEAMRLAEARDRIAWQYTHDFADIFEFGVPMLGEARARRGDTSWAVTELYLALLGAIPDSLIARKRSLEVAEEVRAVSASWAAALASAPKPEAMRAELLNFDRKLKEQDLNPGTTADMTVATIFVADLLEEQSGPASP